MRPGSLAALALASMLLLVPGTSLGQPSDPAGPQYANGMLNGFVTPIVEPGDTFNFSFNVNNPYIEKETTGMAIILTIDIYRYAAQERAVPVDGSFSHPPTFEGGGTSIEKSIGTLAPNATRRVDLEIQTSEKTPHGSYFSQSTYFLRFNLSFMFPAYDETVYVLKSRGWFTDEEWNHIVSFERNETIVNRTYLKSLGVDGLIPDSSFGIKVPIPKWPLALVIAGGIGVSFVALYYFTIENPGRYPRLEKRLYQLRGKLSELRGKLKHRG